jgi:hypothetical protein
MRNSASAVLSGAAVAALGTGLLFSLGGCVQQPRAILPTSSPSAAPVFKSDADALAAAKKTYDGYLAATDLIGSQGGNDPGRIAQWVTSAELTKELKEYRAFSRTGDDFKGASSYTGFRLQQWSQTREGAVSISAYVCDDVSGSRLINRQGEDITPVSRQNIIPLTVKLESSPTEASDLLIGGSTPWSGKDFCSPAE